ncbi:MAG: DUF4912 domain-containing protein [Limisphaerales bacterium]
MKAKKSIATSKLAGLVKEVAAKITKTAARAVPRRSKAKSATPAEPPPETEPAEKPAAKRTRKTAAAAPAAAPKKAVRKAARKTAPKEVELPPILFEGDRPTPPDVGGPGQRYALGPSAPKESFTDETDLPDAYGTKQILLAARDPHWLYAHWDLTRDQLRRYNAMSRDGHLILRVFLGEPRGMPLQETHVHPESRHWFIHVERAGVKYSVELGYYGANKRWKPISASGLTLTPPDVMADEGGELFATIPMEVPLPKLVEIVRAAAVENAPLAEALEELRATSHPKLPPVLTAAQAQPAAKVKPLTPAQKRALAEVITLDEVRRVWIGSLEITELVRRQLERGAGEAESLSSAALAAAQRAGLGGVSSVSSPFGGAAEKAKGFWFNVNAELIIYGATEPDATVTIGGRKIRLRPDGSFSYRFALPDGDYELPATAVSADASDARHATLQFRRATHYVGDVGAHPQDAALKKPSPENV